MKYEVPGTLLGVAKEVNLYAVHYSIKEHCLYRWLWRILNLYSPSQRGQWRKHFQYLAYLNKKLERKKKCHLLFIPSGTHKTSFCLEASQIHLSNVYNLKQINIAHLSVNIINIAY